MLRRVVVIAALFAATAAPVYAQYYQPGGYPPPAPGGYSPSPGGSPQQGSEGYPPPQPEGALPPQSEGYGYGQPYGPPGRRCDAVFETQSGPRRRVCPMGVAKPVGAPCACPPRRPYGPTAEGRVTP